MDRMMPAGPEQGSRGGMNDQRRYRSVIFRGWGAWCGGARAGRGGRGERAARGAGGARWRRARQIGTTDYCSIVHLFNNWTSQQLNNRLPTLPSALCPLSTVD
ncbi:hypothetical protein GCM10022220_49210 [Actinocatenispora rupis]|uniref:Uncharacterized protein n=1 Tax=Actinocatenispora rupis TaxID=519421 RepID=A0A8J3NEG3_9ACTN|nr:hypothetical protein Aru02nite_48910 [Actinocatenispora rupis]